MLPQARFTSSSAPKPHTVEHHAHTAERHGNLPPGVDDHVHHTFWPRSGLEAKPGRQRHGDAGLRVPDQLRVVGFNDSQISRLVRPRLSTISLPMAEMGAMAVRLLVRRIENRSAEVVCSKLPTKLIVRESSTVMNF